MQRCPPQDGSHLASEFVPRNNVLLILSTLRAAPDFFNEVSNYRLTAAHFA